MIQYHTFILSPSAKGFVCQRCGLTWPADLIPPRADVGFETVNADGMTTALVAQRPQGVHFIPPCRAGAGSRTGQLYVPFQTLN